MIIAVSMRVAPAANYREPRDAISHDWITFLQAKAVTPVLVPNTLHDPAGFVEQVGARGLILTGGEDIGPLPGEQPARPGSAERDSTERALLSHALDHNLPVLGVCRGLQMINVYFGGALERDLSTFGKHVRADHPVRIVSRLPWMADAPQEAVTNSFHAQGVVLSGLAPELKAFAVAHGNVVEGLSHASRDIVAVQWHPERINPAADLDRALFEDWLARCG